MRTPSISSSVEEEIWAQLTDGSPVVVTSHERLDGDALGSALALWHGLRGAGVNCFQIFEPPLPGALEFLPGLDQRASSIRRLSRKFTLVVVDSGSLERIGGLRNHLDRVARIINIDHHASNSRFGQTNFVEPSASSCGEMIYRILIAGGVAITREIADCLFTAIFTDTGRFSFSNTTAESLAICAALVRAGCCAWEISDKVYCSQAESALRLQGLAIGTLRLDADGAIATMEITCEMFERTGVHSIDVQGFADLPLSVKGVRVSALLKEMKDESGLRWVKLSLRSRRTADSVDVCAVARSFGGGGHRYAAGCEIFSDVATARRAIVAALRSEAAT